MAQTQSANVMVETCHDCEQKVVSGTGRDLGWGDNHTWICQECQGKRDKQEAEQKQVQTRQGQVLLSILPAIDKAGSVQNIVGGVGHWTAEVRVLVNKREYTITVRESGV